TYKHVKGSCSPCVCKKLTWIIKYYFEFYYNDLLDFSKTRNYLHRITRNPKSATTNPMLIKLTSMLKVAVVHVCANNWHGLLSIILNFTITILNMLDFSK